ncbi:MAG TPA: BTAD domain-containing putative transcriptional regulator, partial [Micromonosporaceae bacterium]|nr:BTAD domain-containing putative transcriptional regulator [Micromonosporaceae bacterium]
MTRAWLDDRPVDLGPAGQRAVLGLLVLGEGRPVTRSALVEALWGDHPPESAVNVVQTRVKHLRKALEPDRPSRSVSQLIPRTGDGYRLVAAPGSVDLAEFRRLVRLAGQERNVDRLDEALRLWHGDPLVDVPVLAGHPAVRALVEERRTVLTRYADAMLADGHADRAVRLLAEAAAAHPLDEVGQARLIRAYQAAGRRAQAFATYHAVREQLVEELGVDPGPELTAAHEALLRADEPRRDGGEQPERTGRTGRADRVGGGRDLPVSVPAPPPVPVPAELPADTGGFVGRQAELAELDRLATADRERPATELRVIVLSGTPGVGKTTLAVRWAHRVRDQFADGQLYVN